MIDQRVLLRCLEQYESSATHHLAHVRDGFDQLSQSWAALDSCYQGDAAESFRAAWTASSAAMAEYAETVPLILVGLRQRIESLRLANDAARSDL
jgi:uncharacterized protein YukE